jgi:hypothetical protein
VTCCLLRPNLSAFLHQYKAKKPCRKAHNQLPPVVEGWVVDIMDCLKKRILTMRGEVIDAGKKGTGVKVDEYGVGVVKIDGENKPDGQCKFVERMKFEILRVK